jgi:hypothetical protein
VATFPLENFGNGLLAFARIAVCCFARLGSTARPFVRIVRTEPRAVPTLSPGEIKVTPEMWFYEQQWRL